MFYLDLCLPPPNLQNGNITDFESKTDDGMYIKKYQCNEGYVLVGEAIRRCSPKKDFLDPSTGKTISRNKWSGDEWGEPECVKSMLPMFTYVSQLCMQKNVIYIYIYIYKI